MEGHIYRRASDKKRPVFPELRHFTVDQRFHLLPEPGGGKTGSVGRYDCRHKPFFLLLEPGNSCEQAFNVLARIKYAADAVANGIANTALFICDDRPSGCHSFDRNDAE